MNTLRNRRRTGARRAIVLFGAVALLGGCATPGAWDPSQASDPLEPVNRGVFWVNDKFDVYMLTPVAKGWDFVAPDPVQTSVANFFRNLRFPVHFLNDVLQGKARAAGHDVARFVVNSTAGVVGLFDPATRLGLKRSDEDFGQTLGHYGVPSGPYLVLPLLGPSNVRDTAGGIADGAATVRPFFVDTLVTIGVRAGEAVNARSRVIDEIEEERASAFDWYVFVRDAYLQRRRAQVRDEHVTPRAASGALYDLPETSDSMERGLPEASDPSLYDLPEEDLPEDTETYDDVEP
jgi:phospholipid-binding lipoprotein MlaA